VDYPTIEGDRVVPVVTIEASGVRFKSFEIVNGSFYGIAIRGSNNTVKLNRLHDNVNGILVGPFSRETHHIIRRNSVYGNEGSGLHVMSDRNAIRRNRANRNHEGVLVAGINNTLTHNRANKNYASGFTDSRSGNGTQGTANFYTDNSCKENGVYGSFPSGLCGPQP
jgi:hypothetical protein